jgi:hypothetical protein
LGWVIREEYLLICEFISQVIVRVVKL